MASMRHRVRSTVARSATARDVAKGLRRRRAKRLISASGLFDEQWYRRQLPEESAAGPDALEHYLASGSGQGLSPSPLFDPGWYRLLHKGSDSGGQDPLAHYLTVGIRQGAAPHPFFDAGWYAGEHPEAQAHRLGALGHYLDAATSSDVAFHPEVDPAAYRAAHPDTAEPLLVHAARTAGDLLVRTRGYRHVPRQVADFDHSAAARFTSETLSAAARRGGEQPLVAVVIPTKDRAQGVLEAARSVLAQTYQRIQLVIVDDGSTDGTHEVLAPVLADPRVEYVRRDTAGGVSVARNAGLARARGTYVAYLDSDNTWKPDFLEVMVAFVTTRGLRVGYAVSELVGEGKRAYRCTPFDAGALRERNYIDCIVLLHERSLLDEVGGFDESLRRMVDWDLMIRMSNVTDFELAPFVATTYDLWEDRADRLSTSEPFGFRYVIKSKRLLDWEAAESRLQERDADLVSVVVHARGGAAVVERCVQRLVERTTGRFEVVVVDTGSTADRALPLQLLALKYPHVPVRVERVSDDLTFEVGSNLGIAASRGATVVVLSSDALVERGWLEPLLEPLCDGRAVATQPLVLRPSGTVLSAGIAFSRLGQPHHLLEDAPWHAAELHAVQDPPALTSICLAARAETLVRARGFDPFYVDAVDGADLSVRLQRASDRALCVVPGSAVVRREPRSQGMPVGDTQLDNRRYFAETHREGLDADAAAVWRRSGHQVVGWRMLSDEGAGTGAPAFRPLVVRDRPPRPVRWAIKTAVPDIVDRQGWGDYYFASALRDAFQRQGHEAVIDCQGAWYRPTASDDDVVLVLRGKAAYTPNPQHVNLMWLISHPDDLGSREPAGYDRLLVASQRFAGELALRYPATVEPLLQCTDQTLFAPDTGGPSTDDVVFVGNSRGVLRPVVRDALDAGLDLVLYGNGWDRFVPPGRVRARYVPNVELARTYSRAGVVLNDHWDDMRRHGFLSNRLFDLAACGARVVSDDVPGLRDVFGDVVLTYDSPESLAEAVKTQLGDGGRRPEMRAELSERVRREHTFDARVARLVALAAELRARRATS